MQERQLVQPGVSVGLCFFLGCFWARGWVLLPLKAQLRPFPPRPRQGPFPGKNTLDGAVFHHQAAARKGNGKDARGAYQPCLQSRMSTITDSLEWWLLHSSAKVFLTGGASVTSVLDMHNKNSKSPGPTER